MIILAIETSCDETAISIIEADGDFAAPHFKVLAHCVSSQTKIHEPFGGVVPNLAKREHSRNLIPLLQEALFKAELCTKHEKAKKLDPELRHKLATILSREPELLEQLLAFVSHYNTPKIDAIAVTRGPGLEPALWVGINAARALSLVWEAPIVPIDHMEGHLLSPLLNYNTKPDFPILALLISGGHTELVLSKSWLSYEKLGQTRDDAVGEAFDKVARLLGLPYPGGPEISKLATQAENVGHSMSDINLPRPMINSGDFDFSFSGLKTAVLYLVQKISRTLLDVERAAIAREFQQAVIDVLLAKTVKAIEKYAPKTLIIAGGVAGNQELQKQFKNKLVADFPALNLLIPETKLTTDNATMIAIAGYFHALKKEFATDIVADGNLSL